MNQRHFTHTNVESSLGGPDCCFGSLAGSERQRVRVFCSGAAATRPTQDWPLALCDFRSIGDDEGVPNELYLVDKLPDHAFAEVDQSKVVTTRSQFFFNPNHEWWYFPEMTRDEVLFFIFHDSDHSRPWRVMHGAFRDPGVQTGVPRHSIEVRTFAFFR
jgi:hypothetical protein